MSARVRWKSARFIPLSVVESILAGKRLNDNQWSVDGPSACLVPAGKPGPFRTSVRWNAAVDRLTGATERHGTACIEFREGCGLWTVVGFQDDQARDRWLEPVKAAFRLLADTGFGGERSRGWGRSETPEFVEGTLPGLIIEYQRPETPPPPVEEPPTEEPPITEPPPTEEPEPTDPIGAATVRERLSDPEPTEPIVDQAPPPADLEIPEPAEPIVDQAPPPADLETPEPAEPIVDQALPPAEPDPQPVDPDPEPVEAALRAPDLAEPLQAPPVEPANLQAHWLLSLFTPAPADAVDWARGSYTVLARGGRIDSPSGSGELKKQIQMVAEGSVLYAEGVPLGAAADVAPDGFAHPVFRAGFALAIPLPEVH
jgi:hypothetical protein